MTVEPRRTRDNSPQGDYGESPRSLEVLRCG